MTHKTKRKSYEGDREATYLETAMAVNDFFPSLCST